MSGITDQGPYAVHDRIGGLQRSAMTMLLNPGTLNRVYDNEYRDGDLENPLTVPEVMDTVHTSIWTELDDEVSGNYTAGDPFISSLRRNLQRAHLERMLDMAGPSNGFGAVSTPVSNLTRAQLRRLQTDIKETLGRRSKLDPYTVAHLQDAEATISRALNSQYIYNTDDIGGGGMSPMMMMFGEEAK